MSKRIIVAISILVILIIITVVVLLWKRSQPSVEETPTADARFAVILDKDLDRIRRRIFHTFVDDLVLPHDVTTDKHYQDLANLMPAEYKEHLATSTTFAFLLKYKHFLDREGVYSLANRNDVDQTFILLLNVILNGVPGDIVETGVWKGGMSLFMKATGDHYRKTKGSMKDNHQRNYWLFDTFDVFPQPEAHSSLGKVNHLDENIHHITKFLYNKPPKLQDVKALYKEFGLLDDSVHFCKGLFKDTIPKLSKHDLAQIALLRVDNDYYDSVLYVLEQLYFRISSGGIVIIHDYNNAMVGCKSAVLYFRSQYSIESPIMDYYGGSVYWIV
jgi:hypothetical protein